MGTEVEVGFANAQRSWEERADLLELLARVLRDNGQATAPHDDGLLHKASGMVLCPQCCGVQPMDRGGVHTVSIIEARHPKFGEKPIFEYQHSASDNLEKSFVAGFESWLRGDLPVLLDALRDKSAECMAMEMKFPEENGVPGRRRRCLFGPVAHMRQRPPSAGEVERGPDGEEKHPFCPCCLFTRTFEAFESLIKSDGFYAIRFFAARDGAGKPEADCRVNGRDWPAGKAALIPYIASWPQAGFEFRRQYVILQSLPPGEGEEEDGPEEEA